VPAPQRCTLERDTPPLATDTLWPMLNWVQVPARAELGPVLLIAALLGASGCLTLTRGVRAPVGVGSGPSGAEVKIFRARWGERFRSRAGGGSRAASSWRLVRRSDTPVAVGTTPESFLLARGAQYIIEVRAPGYEPVRYPVCQSGNRRWWFGNLLWGGPLGMTVDWLTGAMWDFEGEDPRGGELGYAALLYREGSAKARRLRTTPRCYGRLRLGRNR